MAESDLLISFMLSHSLLLVVISAVPLYEKHPILIFEFGRKLKLDGQIKCEAIPIGYSAIRGVIIPILIIGIGIKSAFQVPYIDAILFGAILAATDPVVVVKRRHGSRTDSFTPSRIRIQGSIH